MQEFEFEEELEQEVERSVAREKPARPAAPALEARKESASAQRELAREQAEALLDARRAQPSRPLDESGVERSSDDLRPHLAPRVEAPVPVSATDLAAEAAEIEELQRQQDRQHLMALLNEQENLARMEELRDRHELEAFVEQLEHEKRIQSALRQDEVDRLWEQVRQRREEEDRRRKLEGLSALRDAEALRLEVETVRSQLAERRERRRRLEESRQEERRESDRMVTRHGERAEAKRVQADREFGEAELLLMRRVEERLESLIDSMERMNAETARLASPLEERAAPRVEVPPPTLDFEPRGVAIAAKGLCVAEIDGTSLRQLSIKPFADGYDSSTRSIATSRAYAGPWRVLSGNRRGVASIDPRSGDVLAEYPLRANSKYAVNSLFALPDGGVLATHSEFGVLRWASPGVAPSSVAPEIASARNLVPTIDGFAFSSGDAVFALDSEARGARWIADRDGGRVVTALASAERWLFVGDDQGDVACLPLDDPGAGERPLAAFAVGKKVDRLAVLPWRGKAWLACATRRKTGAYVLLRDLSSASPDLVLGAPERVHSLAILGDGQFAAASERFLSAWDLDRSEQARVVSLLSVAPAQDMAAIPR
jgi:hypothetical protein